MVRLKAWMVAARRGTHMNIIEIYRAGQVGSGGGPQLIFQIKKQIFSNGQIRGKPYGKTVQNRSLIAPCTGSAKIGAAVRGQGLRYKDSPDQLLHGIGSIADGFGRMSGRKGSLCGTDKVEQKKIQLLIFFLRNHVQKIRGDPVVGIQKDDPVSCAGVDPSVPCGRHSLVFLIDQPDAAVLPGILSAYVRAVIGGSVIDQQDLELLVCRSQYRINAARQILFGIVNRYDD